MTNYTKTTDFAAKDSLPSGDSGKIIRGSEFETEFDNIATAVNSKSDANNPTFTGTVTIDGLTVNGNTVLGNAATDTVTVTADIASNLIPSADDTYNLGAVGAEWNDLHVDGVAYIDTIDGFATTGDVTFGDNDEIKMGDTGQFRIFTNGSDSRIQENYSGNLRILANDILLESYSGEKYFRGIADGQVNLYYDNSAKLTTTSTGIDVTGSVTADGLTSSGVIKTEGTSLGFVLNETDTTDLNSYMYLQSGTLRFTTTNDAFNSFDTRMSISNSTGDISFYEDTGTTAKLTWDASAESLNFADNGKAVFGAGSDLQIYHDGTNSYINEVGTGNLNINANRFVVATGAPNYEYMMQALPDGGVLLYHNNLQKLATTFEGIDVTGTVKSDDALIAVSSGYANLYFNDESSSSARYATIGKNYDSPFDLKLTASNSTSSVPIIFNTSSSHTAMQIDSTGIDVTGTVTADDVKSDLFGAADGSESNPSIRNTGDSNTGFYFPAADTIGVSTGGSEAIRIDSSGNLLVGTTSASLAGAGTKIFSDGTTYHTRNGGTPLWVNRETSDGDLLEFRKDNSTVGSIGTNSGSLFIGSGDTGLNMRADLNAIYPWGPTGGAQPDVIDLGYSTVPFKDLYLSGGAYLGGTAAANKLDDYEEGTWTPVYQPGAGAFTTLTMDTPTAEYTKVGQLVVCRAIVRTDNVVVGTASGVLRIGGLPFNPDNFGGTVSIGYATGFASNTPMSGYIDNNSPYVTLTGRTAVGGSFDATDVSDMTTGASADKNYLILTFTYFTNS